MNEHWTTVMLMTKTRQSEIIKEIEHDHFINGYNKRKSARVPSYYAHFRRFGKMLVNLGLKIEFRFRTPDFSVEMQKA